MDTDKIKIYGARVRVDSMAKVRTVDGCVLFCFVLFCVGYARCWGRMPWCSRVHCRLLSAAGGLKHPEPMCATGGGHRGG